jgi:hypothetical protein
MAAEVGAGEYCAVGQDLMTIEDDRCGIRPLVGDLQPAVADGETLEIIHRSAVLDEEAAAQHVDSDSSGLEVAIRIHGSAVRREIGVAVCIIGIRLELCDDRLVGDPDVVRREGERT